MKDYLKIKDGEEILAKVIRDEDGYHVVDNDGTVGPACTKVTVDGYICLTPNAANRKNINKAACDELFDSGITEIPLTFRPTRKVSDAAKIPNAKLIEYLGDEDKQEYLAIIERAKAAYEATKKQPMTDEEKLEARVAKAKAAYEKLLAELGQNVD